MQLDHLQSQLDSLVSRHKMAGASVAIYYNGKLATAVSGTANIVTGEPIGTQTLMHIGSIAKLFTATLILQLVDEGALALDDLVSQHLPDFALKDTHANRLLTVKTLLNHTSGIDGEMLPDYGHDEETIEKGVQRFTQLDQLFQPGDACSYCNAAVVIAGYLAQRITGISWYALIKQRIFIPLGMEYAVTLPEEALLYSAAVGHHLNAETGSLKRTSLALLPLSYSPGGTTLMMSASDLVTFAYAHLNNGVGLNGQRILSEASAILMRQQTAKVLGVGPNKAVGLGWMTVGNEVFGHGGGAPGVVSQLYIHPPTGFAAAVLTNAEHGRALINDVFSPWLEELAGVSLKQSSLNTYQQTEPSLVKPEHYVGVYEDILVRFRVFRNGNSIAITRQEKFKTYDSPTTIETPPIPFVPYEDNIFAVSPDADLAGLSQVDMPRVIKFLRPDEQGQFQFIASPMRLHKRLAMVDREEVAC